MADSLLGVENDFGQCRLFEISVLITETFETLTALEVVCEADPSPDFSNPRVAGSSGVLPRELLVEGYRLAFPAQILTGERHLRQEYRVIGEPATAGRISTSAEEASPPLRIECVGALILSDKEQKLFSEAAIGLGKGNLGPLATYLRSSYRLHPVLARQVAAMIDDPIALYHLLKKKKPGTGAQNVFETHDAKARIARVGRYVELRRPNRHHHGRAIDAAVKEFSYTKRTIEKLWDKYRIARDAGLIADGHWVSGSGRIIPG